MIAINKWPNAVSRSRPRAPRPKSPIRPFKTPIFEDPPIWRSELPAPCSSVDSCGLLTSNLGRGPFFFHRSYDPTSYPRPVDTDAGDPFQQYIYILWNLGYIHQHRWIGWNHELYGLERIIVQRQQVEETIHIMHKLVVIQDDRITDIRSSTCFRILYPNGVVSNLGKEQLVIFRRRSTGS